MLLLRTDKFKDCQFMKYILFTKFDCLLGVNA